MLTDHEESLAAVSAPKADETGFLGARLRAIVESGVTWRDSWGLSYRLVSGIVRRGAGWGDILGESAAVRPPHALVLAAAEDGTAAPLPHATRNASPTNSYYGHIEHGYKKR